MFFYIFLFLLAAFAGIFLDNAVSAHFGLLQKPLLRMAVFFAIACVAYIFVWAIFRKNRRKPTFILIGIVIGKALSAFFLLLATSLLGKNGTINLTPFFDLFFIVASVSCFYNLEKNGFSFTGVFPCGGNPAARRVNGDDFKILDTSVIIDGRIADITETGFLGGVLVVPQFVLLELQQIADSSDGIKRSRGRRGLDILNKMKLSDKCHIKISDADFPEIHEVDTKLIELARTLNGVVLTNDFNLNKVAGIKGISVLNINELANALKPSVLPGEEMVVTIIKEGKDPNQGVAYLDDGTMIVVDHGRNYLNQKITVVVTSVFQTPAGRMIFTQPQTGE